MQLAYLPSPIPHVHSNILPEYHDLSPSSSLEPYPSVDKTPIPESARFDDSMTELNLRRHVAEAREAAANRRCVVLEQELLKVFVALLFILICCLLYFFYVVILHFLLSPTCAVRILVLLCASLSFLASRSPGAFNFPHSSIPSKSIPSKMYDMRRPFSFLFVCSFSPFHCIVLSK